MFDNYSVSVRIMLINQVSSGLMLISRQFGQANQNATAFHNRLLGIERTMRGGMMIAGAGFAGVAMFGKLTKAAGEYQHQLALLNMTGASQKQIADATAAAWKTAGSVITSTATDNLKTVREMQTVFVGGMAEAVRYLPEMQKIAAVLQSQMHGVGGVSAKDVGYTASRMLELRGVSNNPQAFLQEADWLTKIAVATGGKVSPRDMLNFTKLASPYAMGFNRDFLYTIAPGIIQELGGERTGTATTSLMKALLGGQMTPGAAKQWEALGLLKARDFQLAKSGDLATIKRGAITGAGMARENPFEFIQQYLLPAMVAHGITDPKTQIEVIGRLFSNRTAAREAGIMLTQGQRLMKDQQLINQATGVSGYNQLLKTDPVLAQQALAAQFENLKTAFGMEVIPILIPAMIRLAHALRELSAWARANPHTVAALVIAFGALSAAMAFAGVVITLTAAFRGIAMVMQFSGVGGVGGAAGIRAVAAAIGGAGIAGTLIFGLVALGATVFGMAYALNKIAPNTTVDPKNHPGMRWYSTGHGGHWATDPTLDQSHAGMHFVPGGRAHPNGSWVKDITLNVDGKQLAKIVADHSAAAGAGTLRSTPSGANPSLGLPPVSMPIPRR